MNIYKGLLKPANSTKDYFNVWTSGNISRVIIVPVNYSTLSSIRNLTDRLTQTEIRKQLKKTVGNNWNLTIISNR